MNEATLNNLQKLADFLVTPEGKNLFDEKPNAILWYIRQNRIQLVEAGAILKIRNHDFIDKSKFNQAVINIGQARALKSIEGRS
jgi:hypothetical protein